MSTRRDHSTATNPAMMPERLAGHQPRRFVDWNRWAAKALLTISMLLLMAGCGSAPASVHHGSSNGEVPLDVVLQIPSRLETLQPGMTPTQVMATLGLENYPLGGDCSGPTNRIRCQLFLRLDFELALVYDLRPAPSFSRASLVGAGWSKQ
jgi:hypothetical protein